MAKIKDRLAKIIRDKPRVLTRAIFWKIPHNTSEDEVFLKLGRYNKPKCNGLMKLERFIA